ncbi:Spo0E family sporulation regulatory protein-aspartic acid phosphatase [Peribacillus simplex]|uniref:Spo0E family sporulation regulatory protein-aspartic acid phosphatase n=1 Tax=Peribacillus simplex TaxID=1478 RepID=UPI0010BF1CD3|nr:Spo0E family sporulation regulatory protein-aspartic acid phosphatase [Peribacillus simplex]TKH03439.1 Spo0E family sporulation regulatory protein-aspartic acid phosphatase [Peribacillus simplex]
MLLEKHAKTCLQYHLIIEEIECTRKLMISIARETGFMNHQTVEVSQNLDQLLNQLDLVKRRLRQLKPYE